MDVNRGMASQVRKQVDEALSKAGDWLGPVNPVDVSAIPPDQLLADLSATVRALVECVRLLADEIEFR